MKLRNEDSYVKDLSVVSIMMQYDSDYIWVTLEIASLY